MHCVCEELTFLKAILAAEMRGRGDGGRGKERGRNLLDEEGLGRLLGAEST